MRPVGGAENVVGVTHIGHPVAHGLVDGFLERLLSRINRHDGGAEHAHPEDVERLPFAVDRAHVDDAFEPEHRRYGGSGHAVLAGTGLGDDALFAHALGQQDLPHGVVDLVGAGVQQVLALKVNLRAAKVAGESFGVVERGWAATKFAEIILQLGLEFRILLCTKILVLEFLQRVHEGFRDVAPAVFAKAPVGVGEGLFNHRFHAGDFRSKTALGQAAI